jgi:hypothetical protein
VLSQSGAFGSGMTFQTNPAILAYRDAARVPIRFYLDVGLFEGLPVQLSLNELPLVEGLTTGNRHFRDDNSKSCHVGCQERLGRVVESREPVSVLRL